MCEVTKENFATKLPLIKSSLTKSKFISIDLEFSALEPLLNESPSLFDTNVERYAKLRKNLSQVVPLQIGITAFHFDNETNHYFGEVFTFYVQPACFNTADRSFYFQASTLAFLTFNNFDLNKFAYSGVPYLSRAEAAQLRLKLQSGELNSDDCNLRAELRDAIRSYRPIIAGWLKRAQEGEALVIPDILVKFQHYHEVLYHLHGHFREEFKVWSYIENNCFCVKRVEIGELERLKSLCTLNDSLLETLSGFRSVFDLLTTLQKPIIGHNLLQDLMILINNFEAPLPLSYPKFKLLANQLLPVIFDTKTIFYEIRRLIPKEKLPIPGALSLKELFEYFKDGVGRHLATCNSAIEDNYVGEKRQFHDAGWDSFCTGYIFIRMGYFKSSLAHPKRKEFVSGEIINGLGEFKNCVNVIRGSTSYIKLDGGDPDSRRPPWLIVEAAGAQPLDIKSLRSQLSLFGSVDIKRFSTRDNRVLVAVDTFRTAREITASFCAHPNFQIKQYALLRHSPVVQAALAASVTVSGALLLWLTHSFLKRR